MNEQTHFFIKIYLSHFILERVYVVYVWAMGWRRGKTAILTPSSSDHNSTSSSSWLGCSTKALCLPLFIRLFTQVHLLIDGSVEVNMLQLEVERNRFDVMDACDFDVLSGGS